VRNGGDDGTDVVLCLLPASSGVVAVLQDVLDHISHACSFCSQVVHRRQKARRGGDVISHACMVVKLAWGSIEPHVCKVAGWIVLHVMEVIVVEVVLHMWQTSY